MSIRAGVPGPGADGRPAMGRGRLEAFSDGVFAVAITILALNLKVAGPGPGHPSLWNQVVHSWPSYAAYVVSFFTIGIVWVNHHALIQSVRAIDRVLLFLNLVLLLFVVLIPIATDTMAQYLTGGGQDASLAAALYGAVNEGMALGFVLMFRWSLQGDRLLVPVPPERRRAFWARSSLGAVAYLVAIGIGFGSAPLALVAYGAIDLYYVFEQFGPKLAARGTGL